MYSQKTESIIASNIKKYRNKKGISQSKLSEISGVAYNTIIKIEAGGSRNPTIDTMSKLSQALNVGIDDLVKN